LSAVDGTAGSRDVWLLASWRFLHLATGELVISSDRRESRNLVRRELEIPPLRFAPVGMTARLREGEAFLGL